MSPTRSRYKELCLRLIDPLKDYPYKPWWPHMEQGKRDEGVGDLIKLFLEESIMQKRDKMMDNFSKILSKMKSIVDESKSSVHFGSMPLFNV